MADSIIDGVTTRTVPYFSPEEKKIMVAALATYYAYLTERYDNSKNLEEWHFFDDRLGPAIKLWHKIELA